MSPENQNPHFWQSRPEVGHPYGLVEIEMKDVDDLEVGAVHQHQVAADENMSVVRGRRRKHDLHFVRAGLHVRPHAGRQNAMHNEGAFLSG